MLEAEKVEKLLERNTIEIAPIAFMRGRTLNDSFIILDEAQNSTAEQMKMVLTRQGFNSKMVVTGDVTQIDLPPQMRSGLVEVVEVVDLTGDDVHSRELVVAREPDHEQDHQRRDRRQPAQRKDVWDVHANLSG